MLNLLPLSVTGAVVFTASLALVVVAVLGIYVVMRGKRGE